MFVGKRLKQARELWGLTQAQLAKKIGVSQGAIAHFEGGFKEPSRESLLALAGSTRVPVSFFSKQLPEEFSLHSLLFRAHASMSRRKAVEASRHAELVYEMASHLRSQIEEPPPTLPEFPNDPEFAAQQTRAALGLLPDSPVPNLLSIVEKSGVLVLALPVTLEGRDAFSLWAGPDSRSAVIAISDGRPTDRLRLSVAHELGHLVMLHHRSNRPEDERSAFIFGAEFLMPKVAMRREIRTPVTLSSIAPMKPRWKVSVQALIRRAFSLRIISERQYHHLFEQLGRKGWKLREPANLDIPTESPRRIRQMAEMIYGNPVDYVRLSSDVHLGIDYARAIIARYAEGPSQTRPRERGTGKVIEFRPA